MGATELVIKCLLTHSSSSDSFEVQLPAEDAVSQEGREKDPGS